MKKILEKFYIPLFYGCLLLALILAFFLGVQEGERKGLKGETGVVISKSQSTTRVSSGAFQKEETSNVPVRTLPFVSEEEETQKETGRYVGSKNGTKYYTPGCSGTNRIKPENYVWFDTVEDATLQGYTKGSC